ncbi:SipW-dependent-type signal peptide-containing protein [Corynebacterium sp. NPDC060344]|uniref:SipW-dependent-type signal peptide-containing protein n=1 Tax=Corynebacterium sp. NPDC060344 TaxID=3347101 RepID=UPI00365765F0
MSTNSRKIRAFAAGGAVLGLGAIMTLAAWSDSEFATGTFGTQNFGIEASKTSATEEFADHATAGDALVLTADLAEAGTMEPGDTITIDYWIRNIEDAADSKVTFANQSETGPFEVRVLDDNAALAQGQSFNLTGQEANQLQFEVTLPEDYSATEKTSTTITWEFTAEATE